MPKFEIKKLKTSEGHEGPSFTCDLHVDGIKATHVINEGNGGSYYWYWERTPQGIEAKAKWDAYVASLPDATYPPEWGMGAKTYRREDDEVLAVLVEEFETQRRFKRQATKKTLVRMHGEDESVYHIYNRPYTPEFATQLRIKLGAKLKEIINETLAKAT